MITKEQLQVMSDFELGKALAIKCGKTIADEQYFHYGDRDENVVLLFPQGESFNINNPSDIMPLAFEHKICFSWKRNGLCLTHKDGGFINHDCQDANPLRAIACCLILVLQEKNNGL